MQIINELYFAVLFISFLIYCLVRLVAPGLGVGFGFRLLASFVLYIESVLLRPGESSSLLGGALRLLLSFLCFVCSVLCLFVPSVARTILSSAAAKFSTILLLAIAVWLLWGTGSGRIILLLAVAILTAVLIQRRTQTR